ncbi:EbsA family protein [Enterococcus rivorum]|uniref:EbsA protein n=1 Tax=Enterococcus rivorum TaxID=762845 RepID=A0A1E5KWH8_9ENTE|nr:EbsA family protein [Enterococcus rivorum]MBP2100040.1 hypothetical protein [Enterococcus rivorum]OEH82236.1 hypothetical protein BCR26_13830 [Enterococcus rivorum]
MKKKIYHWQPELSMAIIYWSCTFGILFISLILTLENTRPYLTSNIVLVIFFLFFALGLNRYFKIGDDDLFIHALLPRRRKKVPLNSISTIRVGPKSLEIYSTALKEGSQLFIMTKKSKHAFIESLNKHSKIIGEIIYDENQKIGKH